MNYPPDPYTMLWQELALLQRLVQQFDVLLAMLAAYALLLFVGIGLVLVSAVLRTLVQRVEVSGHLLQERATRSAIPALPLSHRRYRPRSPSVLVAGPAPSGKGMRWRSTFSPYFHRPR